VTVISLTRSSAVTERPRDVPCAWNFCCHSKSHRAIRIYAAE